MLAAHRAVGMLVGDSRVGLLDQALSGEALLGIAAALYAEYARQAGDPRPAPDRLGFAILDDGNTDQTKIYCWGTTPTSITAMRRSDIEFTHDASGAACVQWRTVHLIVDASGARSIDFCETLALPVAGINPLAVRDNPP